MKEEEKRQLELLAKKKAEEEEQARKLAEARRALELRREQERERERQLERERLAAAERLINITHAECSTGWIINGTGEPVSPHAGLVLIYVASFCTIRMLLSVLQGTSGERKSSGSAARTGESSEREGEERTGGEKKGARGKKETGKAKKDERASACPGHAAQRFKCIFSGLSAFFQEERLRLAAEQKAAKEREAAKQKEAAAKQVNQSRDPNFGTFMIGKFSCAYA